MDITNIVEKFKNREVKAKQIFDIREIDKDTSYQFIRKYHYLGDAKFFSMYCYGLYMKDTNYLVGCATFSLPQGKDTTKGWFNLPSNCRDIVELSRLCMLPCLNGTNATSYLLGNSMQMLRGHGVRAIITLADANRHIGSIYQVCNFTYYGLSHAAVDFIWAETGKKLPHDLKQTNEHGVHIMRTRKHRYAYILDPTLKCNYAPQPHPKTKGETIEWSCCNNHFVLEDTRFHEYYTCPKCTSKMVKITKDEYDYIMSLSDKDVSFVKDEVEKIILKYRRETKDTYVTSLF